MKDQVTALMEAMRLVRRQVDDCNYRHKSPRETVEAIERILKQPPVQRATQSLEPFVDDTPSTVPTESEMTSSQSVA